MCGWNQLLQMCQNLLKDHILIFIREKFDSTKVFPLGVVEQVELNSSHRLPIYSRNDLMTNRLYTLMKRRGFAETLKVLGSFDKCEAVQSKFFEKFEQSESYYNAYLRVKKQLLDTELIKFKLNENNEKVIFLTDKGKKVLEKMEEIEKIIN